MQANRSEAVQLARGLMRHCGAAALATLDADGAPFASHVATAPGPDGAPVLLLSRLAVHTENIRRDPRSSLLLVRFPTPGGDAMTAERLTLTGSLHPHPDQDGAGRAFLARHPDAAHYAGFGDFRYFGFTIRSGHLVAGFGRISALIREELLGSRGSTDDQDK